MHSHVGLGMGRADEEIKDTSLTDSLTGNLKPISKK